VSAPAKSLAASVTSVLLAFVSGFVDTAAFVHMGGLFVAHVTGNFVLLGATLAGVQGSGAHSASSLTLQLASFPIFFVAAMLATGIASRVRPERATRILLAVAVAALAVAGALGVPGLRLDPAAAMILVVAMGVLNAAQRLDASLGPPFTVMTGNVTGVAIAASRTLGLARQPKDPGPAADSRPLAALVLAFGLGCASGAVAQSWLGLAAVLIVAVALGLRIVFRLL